MCTAESNKSGSEYDISAIIISNSRKEYVLEAFNSILKQDFPKQKLEIIVVKGYRDDKIDRELKDGGAKLALEEGNSLGAKLAKGISLAKGNIISFLDDDDLWTTNKLSEVYSTFLDRRIGYYNNTQVFVDTALNPLSNKHIPKEISNIKKIGQLRISNQSPMFDLGKTYKLYGDFNSSSVSARRVLLTDHSELFEKTRGALDSLIFYICLASGMDILIDDRPLTIYRKHLGNITGKNSTTRIENAPFSVRQCNGFQDIVKHIATLGNHRSLKLVRPVYYGLGIISRIESNRINRLEMLKLFSKYCIYGNIFIFLARKDFFFYGLIGIFSPSICRRVYSVRH